jgi:hypothetical protein
MGWLEEIFGKWIRRLPDWDGAERRQSFRVRCDFEIEIQAPGRSYLAKVVDAGPQGLRLRVRGPWVPKVLKRSQLLNLRYVQPLYEADLDSVGASIRWVRREGKQLFSMAVSFADSVDNLRRSWVKPVLRRYFKTESRRNLRQWLRARCNLVGKVSHQGRQAEVKVTDISSSGARLSSLEPIAIGEILELYVEGMVLRCSVRRCQADYGVFRVGVHFAPDKVTRKKVISLVRKLVEVDRIVGG